MIIRSKSAKISLFVIALATCLIFAASASAKVIELTVNDHNPGVSTVSKAWDDWGKWLEDHSDGKVKVTIHHGGALLKGDEAYRGVQTGIAANAHYVLNAAEGFGLNAVMTLPFMNWPDQLHTANIYKGLLQKYPKMVAEWQGVIPLGIIMMPPTHIHTAKKAVKTPADLKGLKLHGAEVALIQVMGASGATPVQLDIADMYMSLDRGLIDGVMNHFPVLGVFGVLKLMPNHTIFGEGGMNMTPMFNIMNAEVYNKLPADVQKVVKESGKIWEERQLHWDGISMKQAMDSCKGHNFVKLTPDEIKVWYDLVKGPIHDKWIKENEKNGAKAIYEDALAQAAKSHQ